MYCGVNDIVNELSESVVAQLSNDANPNAIDVNIVQYYIQIASELIDSFLRGRYKLPLAKEHSFIRKLCIEITKYELYKRRGKLNEAIQDAYREAISTLEKIQKGSIVLDEGAKEDRPAFIITNRREAIYSKELLDGYMK